MGEYKLLKIVNVMLLVLLLSSINCVNAKAIYVVQNDTDTPMATVIHPIFHELIDYLKSSANFKVAVSSITVKKTLTQYYSYASFGTFDHLKVENPKKIQDFDIPISISDRNNFSGKKTIESFSISSRGSQVYVTITYKTWGNKIIELNNVNIAKIGAIFLISGNLENNEKVSHYTISIFNNHIKY